MDKDTHLSGRYAIVRALKKHKNDHYRNTGNIKDEN
jgi:hypothetical protein